MAKLIVPPDCPAFLLGFLNLRGTPVAVVRTAELLGLSLSPALYTPLIVLRNASRPCALLVERATGFFQAETCLPVAPENSLNGCVESVVTAAGRSALLLAVDRLLIEQEHQALSKFGQRIEERILTTSEPYA